MYTSPNMQNQPIAAMSSAVIEGIKQEFPRYRFKVDGTKDPTGVANISMIIRFFNEHSLKSAERLLVLSSTDDVKSITDVIFAELTEAGLTSSEILSQVYNGAFVMAVHCGGVQRLLQKRENRKIPYVHCLNHYLHQAINDFLHVCNSLYSF